MYNTLFIFELITICIFACPILFWHDIIYLPTEHYCYITFTNTRSTLWLIIDSYGIPLMLLLLIYLRILIFIHRQPNHQTFVIIQRQQRDLCVIQRIFIIVGLLITLGIPTIVLLLMFYITGEKYILFDRIAWFSVSLSMTQLSISLVILTTQLKRIVLEKRQSNRVLPINGILDHSLEIRR